MISLSARIPSNEDGIFFSAYFGALMNCWVHVVMYAYYGLSAIPSLRDKLWWKKYITNFQLVRYNHFYAINIVDQKALIVNAC